MSKPPSDISLRDWFAGMALHDDLTDEIIVSPSDEARRAYEFADAMLKERSVGENAPPPVVVLDPSKFTRRAWRTLHRFIYGSAVPSWACDSTITSEQIAQVGESDLLGQRNVGKTTLHQVRQGLLACGVAPMLPGSCRDRRKEEDRG